jgi:choline dehydrogenase-like flavoprotein
VGAGPVGLALALECVKLGLSVVVLESGRLNADSDISSASEAETSGNFRHASMTDATCRRFGGASWLWAGRCVPFDPIDFDVRSYVPYSGWPISFDEIAQWFPAASQYLECGDNIFTSPSTNFLGSDGCIKTDLLERWSSQPRIAEKYCSFIERSNKVSVYLDSTVIDIDVDESNGKSSVVIGGSREPIKITAKSIVIAAGGLESTRLLLAARHSRPGLFGGLDGPLGRYYMGHLSGKISTIKFAKPSMASDFDYCLDEGGHYVRRRFSLTAEVQLAKCLLNVAMWPDNPPLYDPQHKSGVLSALYIAFVIGPIGRRLLPEAIRANLIGVGRQDWFKHIRNIIFDSPIAALQIASVIWSRYFSRYRKPGIMIKNRSGCYALTYHAEQVPNPNSRVILSKEVDRYGMPRIMIDLRFTQADVDSVIRSHDLLDNFLRKTGKGEIEFWYPRERLADVLLSSAGDGIHQVGTTRMGLDPRTSVVDQNLKVHGLANLFVVGSSVMPTTGQANPTFVAVALAFRLAHHLRSFK